MINATLEKVTREALRLQAGWSVFCALFWGKRLKMVHRWAAGLHKDTRFSRIFTNKARECFDLKVGLPIALSSVEP